MECDALLQKSLPSRHRLSPYLLQNPIPMVICARSTVLCYIAVIGRATTGATHGLGERTWSVGQAAKEDTLDLIKGEAVAVGGPS
jgi:hypothetical protein